MHGLDTIVRRNLDAPWREYRHAIDAGDLALAHRIYWAELNNVVSIIVDDPTIPSTNHKAAVRERLAKGQYSA